MMENDKDKRLLSYITTIYLLFFSRRLLESKPPELSTCWLIFLLFSLEPSAANHIYNESIFCHVGLQIYRYILSRLVFILRLNYINSDEFI